MEVSIRVNEEDWGKVDVKAAMDNELVEIKGLLMSMHITDGAIDKAFAAQEMLENLIGMGLIDSDALEGIGYYSDS